MKRYKKNVISHPVHYIVSFTRKESAPYVIFIHGGPGLNCGVLEYLIEHNSLFKNLSCNIILYDQRNCGRSSKSSETVLHHHNVDDLYNLISYLKNKSISNINGLMGHSYGSKVLFDYYKKYNCTLPGVFLSTTESILIPRLNNLMLDLNFLKKIDPRKYEESIRKIKGLDVKQIWNLTETLDPLFQKNPDRLSLYWANLKYLTLIQKIQGEIKLPMEQKTFTSVRKDLYANESNFMIDINSLNIPKLWINGLHDFIMNGQEQILLKNPSTTVFYQSAHYPHIEENEYFCDTLNDFFNQV